MGARPARAATPRPGRAVVGISGYDYRGWAGVFFPPGLPKRRWLEHAIKGGRFITHNLMLRRAPAGREAMR